MNLHHTHLVSTITGSGINLMLKHHQTILETQPAINWFEVHPEHYFGRRGGFTVQNLEQIRQQYPITFHGVGLSLGSTAPLDWQYLTNLKTLIQQFQPAWFSEHISWASAGSRHFHDLIPLPYCEEAVLHIAKRIHQVQDFLEQQILVENISSYMAYKESDLTESEFISAVLTEADCYLLLDINNLYVNSFNHSFSAFDALNQIPLERVKQIHLAGYSHRDSYLIDTHGEKVHEPVWQLYEAAITRFGAVPTLIEWESNVPDFAVVKSEADKANHYLQQSLLSQLLA
ncbi:MNIO family bufferin maturase [Nostoc sp.]|uniref:MNIO family bufferin maturase n=1 Tax=Nostoc sp. TaxID=1180 RepID=UPI002FFC18A5